MKTVSEQWWLYFETENGETRFTGAKQRGSDNFQTEYSGRLPKEVMAAACAYNPVPRSADWRGSMVREEMRRNTERGWVEVEVTVNVYEITVLVERW